MTIRFCMLLFALLVLLDSCSQQKYVFSSNEIYHNDGLMNIDLNKETVTKGYKTKITDKGDYLIIASAPPSQISAKVALSSPPTGNTALDIGSKRHFPDENMSKRKFTYFDSKFSLQGMSIPIKIRPALSGSLRDTFPMQAETGVSVALAPGWKFVYNVFNTNKNILGQNTSKYSITPGLMLGLSGVDLKKANTREPSVAIERKAPMFTTGLYLMFGFNSINIGYAIGKDYPWGSNSQQWVYYNKTWHGLVVAIDLIK